MTRRIVVGLLLAIACLACGPFHRLRGEVKRLDTDHVIRGRITEVAEKRGFIYVIVFRWPTPEIVEFVDVAKLTPVRQEFAFLVPGGDGYLVGAVQDLDGDDQRGADEPIWFYGDPSAVTFEEDRRSEWLDVRLASPFRMPPAELLHAFATARAGRSMLTLTSGRNVPIAAGEVADLEAPRFSAAAGTQGLWEPMTFLSEYGTGVFFVEPYDPRRLPVLFVNGAGGSPQNFRSFFDGLDRERYQAWFFLYPSGLPLELSARMLGRTLDEVQTRHDFDSLAVVAHSMGGLVARGFVQSEVKSARAVSTFATLSTPWHGHGAAALGVKHAPVAIPSWRDMVPGSPFQEHIFERPLDPRITACLGFTFRGRRRIGLPQSNDGAVAVSSQLAEPAQAQAAVLHGFNETHTSVLRSEDALRFVGECLASD